MKGYIVKDLSNSNNYSGDYLVYEKYEPWFDEETNNWMDTEKALRIYETDISDDIKIPEGKEIVEVNISIIPKDIKCFVKGSKVTYTKFNLASWLFGGMLYGGYHNTYIVEVQGIDWYNKKILVQKHDDKKPKWYNWDNFSI